MLRNLSGGIQNFLLRFRLLRQAGGILFLWLALVFTVTNFSWIYYKTNQYDYYVIYKLIQAKGLMFFSHVFNTLGSPDLGKSIQQMDFQEYNGINTSTSATNLLHQSGTYTFEYHLKSLFYEGLIGSFILSFLFILFISVFMKERGKKNAEEKHLRGAQLVDSEDLKAQLIEKDQASDIFIAGVPLPKDSETQHILIIGTPGSGKTVCMSEILAQIRKKGQRAIVYDKMGVYTKRFYRPDKDILLNPLDERCPSWNVWAECSNAAHYDAMAESLIPMPTQGQDPFWVMAARIMFAVAARKLKHNGEMSTPRLLRYLLMADLNRIQELIVNTEAESLASEKAEKMALSVKAVLSTYLKSLRYLKDTGNPFSIRDWIANDTEDDSWIFITSRGDQHATLKPLISTWLDVGSNAMMSLPPKAGRRIHIACDETDSLQYIPSLPDFATQGRQFGCCGIFSVQAISQFFKNFGEDDAETIISCCNTGIYFRSRGKVTAPYVTDLLGEEEVEEVNENVSYGTAGTRESVSVHQQRNIKRIILPSQIKRLNDLEAYLQLKGDWPITKIKFNYQEYPENEPAFISRPIDVDVELENMMRQIKLDAKNQGIVVESPTRPKSSSEISSQKGRMVEL